MKSLSPRSVFWFTGILLIFVFYSDMAYAKMNTLEWDSLYQTNNSRASSMGGFSIYGMVVSILALVASLVKGNGGFFGIGAVYVAPLFLFESIKFYWLAWIWVLLPFILLGYFYFKTED